MPTLFPANYASLLQHFFAATIGRRPATVSQIRSEVCEDLGAIEPTHAQWGAHRIDLQYCAAHQAGGVVLRHYTVSTPPCPRTHSVCVFVCVCVCVCVSVCLVSAREKETERGRKRETGRETDRASDRETDRQTERERERESRSY